MLAEYERKYLFITVFVALSLVFSFYQFSFFWGNHDWDWIKGTTQVLSLNTGMFEGRYTKFVLNVILFAGQVYPILNTIIAFALLAMGSVLLISYWGITKKTDQIIISLLPVISPFILGWLYFPINILGNFAAVLLVLGGLLFAERKGKIYKIVALIYWVLALGIYPSVIEMIIICFCFRYILYPVKRSAEMCPIIGVMLAAIVLFKILLSILATQGILYTENYNLQTVLLSELPQRILPMISLAFKQLWATIPFFPYSLKIFGVGLILLSLSIVATQRQALLLWSIALFATITSSVLAANPTETAYMPRINFYGLNFFYTGAAAVALHQKSFKRNVAYVACLLFIVLSVRQDIYAQKVWFLGKNAEQYLVDRVSSRIEDKVIKKPIVPVIAGEISLRPRYYIESYQHNSPYILNNAFLIRHIPSGMYNFYAAQTLFWPQAQIGQMSQDLFLWLKQASRAWPADESIFVDDMYAVLLMTPQGIKEIKAQLPH